MKTFVESLNSAVRNWWLSLLLGILYIALAIWLFANPLASYLAISMVFSVFMFVSGLSGVIFALGNPACAGQLGLVSFGGHYRSVGRYSPVGFSGVEHGRTGVYFGFLAVVPGLFGHRSCYRFAALWCPQLGMVTCAGYPGGYLCCRHSHGSGCRGGDLCRDGRVRFAGLRDLPDSGRFRTQEIAQTPVKFP